METATFENVVLPIARMENEKATESRILRFYKAVSANQELRVASTEASKLFDQDAIESGMRQDLFDLVEAVLKKNELLDPESRRLLEIKHKSYILKGLNLPAGHQQNLKQINVRLSKLIADFRGNLNEESGGIWFTLNELDGVPGDVIDTLKKGGVENEGKFWLTFKDPHMVPTLKYATNAETRKRLFIGNENKCNQNVPLFREIVLLRDEAARILGYDSHADRMIGGMMAKLPKTVNDFLGDLRTSFAPGGRKEMANLLKLKQQDLKDRSIDDPSSDKYFMWDHPYYDRIMLEKDFALD